MSFLRVLLPFARVGSMQFRQNAPADGRLVQMMARRNLCSGGQLIFEVEDYDEYEAKVLGPSSNVPILVDCYADWCGPCKNLTPRLEEKIRNLGGSILLAKVNVDNAGELATELHVSAVPTVIAIKNGASIGQFTGDQSDEALDTFLESIINENPTDDE